jgi:hypothetical protein
MSVDKYVVQHTTLFARPANRGTHNTKQTYDPWSVHS